MPLTVAAVLAGLATAGTNVVAPRPVAPPFGLTVCVTMSPALAIGGQLEAAVLSEVNAIWQRYRVAVRRTSQFDESCDRAIVVRSDLEARSDDLSGHTALAWVPFVKGRARRVVFLRLNRARVLVGSLSPGTRPDALTGRLVARLIGRSLAHELGHVLLNSTTHATAGLMRARYRATDVLRDPLPTYTLDEEQRDQLYSSLSGRQACSEETGALPCEARP